ASVDRLGQVGGDLGVTGLEFDLWLAGPLEVGVEGEEVDDPGAGRAGELGDGLQLGQVVADHRHVEPERDTEGAQVVQRGTLAGEVVATTAVNLTYSVADAVDGHQEVVNAGLGEGTSLVEVRQVHPVRDHRGPQPDPGSVGDKRHGLRMQSWLPAH